MHAPLDAGPHRDNDPERPARVAGYPRRDARHVADNPGTTAKARTHDGDRGRPTDRHGARHAGGLEGQYERHLRRR